LTFEFVNFWFGTSETLGWRDPGPGPAPPSERFNPENKGRIRCGPSLPPFVLDDGLHAAANSIPNLIVLTPNIAREWTPELEEIGWQKDPGVRAGHRGPGGAGRLGPSSVSVATSPGASVPLGPGRGSLGSRSLRCLRKLWQGCNTAGGLTGTRRCPLGSWPTKVGGQRDREMHRMPWFVPTRLQFPSPPFPFPASCTADPLPPPVSAWLSQPL